MSGSSKSNERIFSSKYEDESNASLSVLVNLGSASTLPNTVPLRELISYLIGGRGGSSGHDFVDIIVTLKTRTCRANLRSVALNVLRSIMCVTTFHYPKTEMIKIISQDLCQSINIPQKHSTLGLRYCPRQHLHPLDSLGGSGPRVMSSVLVSYRSLVLSLSGLLSEEHAGKRRTVSPANFGSYF